MKNKEFFTEILTKPIRYSVLIASLLTTFTLLIIPFLLPSEMSISSSLIRFLNDYSGFIFLIFSASFFLLIVQLVPDIHKKYEENRTKNYLKKMKKELYEDEIAWNILLKLYHANGEPILLVGNNQKVKLLRQYSMIIATSDRAIVSAYNMHNAKYPHILQPETEKYIRNFLNKQSQE